MVAGVGVIKVHYTMNYQGELVEPVALNENRLRQAQADSLLI
jgi:hypothetical protein